MVSDCRRLETKHHNPRKKAFLIRKKREAEPQEVFTSHENHPAPQRN